VLDNSGDLSDLHRAVDLLLDHVGGG
jgi:hypothetical protein